MSVRVSSTSRLERKRCGLAGFTIVELLVVVSVVALLVALLLPSLEAARDHAQLVGCRSNQRQIGIALHTYTADHDEKLPWFETSGNPPTNVAFPIFGRDMGLSLLRGNGYVSLELLRGDPGRPAHDDLGPHCDYAISWYAPVPLKTCPGWPCGDLTSEGFAPRLEHLRKMWPRYPPGGGVKAGMGILLADARRESNGFNHPGKRAMPHENRSNVLRLDGAVAPLPSPSFFPAVETHNCLPYQRHEEWWGWAHAQAVGGP